MSLVAVVAVVITGERYTPLWLLFLIGCVCLVDFGRIYGAFNGFYGNRWTVLMVSLNALLCDISGHMQWFLMIFVSNGRSSLDLQFGIYVIFGLVW